MKFVRKLSVAAIAIVTAFAVVIVSGYYILKFLYPVAYLPEIKENCAKYDIDPYLCLAMIKAESNFVTDAQSAKDATGLMQITEPTAIWIAEKLGYEKIDVQSLNDPKINIEFGVWYLAYLLERYNNDVTLALCAYNAGQGNVDEWLKDAKYSSDGTNLENIPFPETENYVKQIRRNIKIYKTLYPDINKAQQL